MIKENDQISIEGLIDLINGKVPNVNIEELLEYNKGIKREVENDEPFNAMVNLSESDSAFCAEII